MKYYDDMDAQWVQEVELYLDTRYGLKPTEQLTETIHENRVSMMAVIGQSLSVAILAGITAIVIANLLRHWI